MASAAGLAIVMQLYLTLALATVSDNPGLLTAYSYAYLTLTVIAGTTVGTIGMVTMPLAVEAVAKHGKEAAIPFLRDTGAAGFFLYWPLALCYALFAYPLIHFVFAGSLSPDTLELFWDGSRIFVLLGFAWAFGFPFTTLALASHMYVRVAIGAAVQLPFHLLAVSIASSSSELSVVATHTATGIFLIASLAVVVMGKQAARAAFAIFRASAMAFLIGVPIILLRLLLGPPATIPVSIGCIVAGALMYVALSYKATPNLGGRMIDQLIGRVAPR